jgi:hypothetical protein
MTRTPAELCQLGATPHLPRSQRHASKIFFACINTSLTSRLSFASLVLQFMHPSDTAPIYKRAGDAKAHTADKQGCVERQKCSRYWYAEPPRCLREDRPRHRDKIQDAETPAQS